ncbi:MAG: hypothetical protein AB2693_34360, partial [Candidatus Thiodiazotropha sp.]
TILSNPGSGRLIINIGMQFHPDLRMNIHLILEKKPPVHEPLATKAASKPPCILGSIGSDSRLSLHR